MDNIAQLLSTQAKAYQKDSRALQASVLELAAALVKVAQLGASVGGGMSIEVSAGVASWLKVAGELLTGVATSLNDLHGAFHGKPASTSEDSLLAAANRLISATGEINQTFSTAAVQLREEGAVMLKRASTLGHLTRALQMERLRLAVELESCSKMEEKLAEAKNERGQVIEKIELLQERLRLSGAAVDEVQALEGQVKVAEAEAQQGKHKFDELQNQLADLKQKVGALPEQIEATRSLIQQLESSPEHEAIGRIKEIWQQIPMNIRGGRG